MKTLVSALIVLALIVLFAQAILPLGSYTSREAAKRRGHFFIEVASSKATVQGVEAAWANDGRHRSAYVRK